MAEWYRPDDVRTELELPPTFNVAQKLGKHFKSVVRYQLLPMLGQTKADEVLAWLEPLESDQDSPLKPLYDEVFLFLVFAAWAEYHVDGYLDYTNTGPVQKISDNSAAISGQQRTEIRVKYEGKAAIHAVNIQRLLATNTTADCGATYYTGRPTITKASGSKPRFY